MFVAAMKNALLPRPHILGGPPGCQGSACPPPQGSSPSLTPPTRPSARRDDVSPSSTALCMDQEANRQVTALAPTQAHICMWTAHRDLQPWSSHLRARHCRLNRVLQKRNVLPPSSCEYDHFWKKGLCICTHDEVIWDSVGPESPHWHHPFRKRNTQETLEGCS